MADPTLPSERTIDELADSVELLCRNVTDEDCEVRGTDMQNARELVVRVRCALIAIASGHHTEVVEAALTGAKP